MSYDILNTVICNWKCRLGIISHWIFNTVDHILNILPLGSGNILGVPLKGYIATGVQKVRKVWICQTLPPVEIIKSFTNK